MLCPLCNSSSTQKEGDVAVVYTCGCGYSWTDTDEPETLNGHFLHTYDEDPCGNCHGKGHEIISEGIWGLRTICCPRCLGAGVIHCHRCEFCERIGDMASAFGLRCGGEAIAAEPIEVVNYVAHGPAREITRKDQP